jgi:hypothetical protein
LLDIGGHFLTDQELEQNLSTRLTCVHLFKIDRSKGVLNIRWQSHLSNYEIDTISVGLIGALGHKKRK